LSPAEAGHYEGRTATNQLRIKDHQSRINK